MIWIKWILTKKPRISGWYNFFYSYFIFAYKISSRKKEHDKCPATYVPHPQFKPLWNKNLGTYRYEPTSVRLMWCRVSSSLNGIIEWHELIMKDCRRSVSFVFRQLQLTQVLSNIDDVIASMDKLCHTPWHWHAWRIIMKLSQLLSHGTHHFSPHMITCDVTSVVSHLTTNIKSCFWKSAQVTSEKSLRTSGTLSKVEMT